MSGAALEARGSRVNMATLLAAAALAAVVIAIAVRTVALSGDPQVVSVDKWGLADFRDNALFVPLGPLPETFAAKSSYFQNTVP